MKCADTTILGQRLSIFVTRTRVILTNIRNILTAWTDWCQISTGCLVVRCAAFFNCWFGFALRHEGTATLLLPSGRKE